jgi:hypothetical protein
LPATAQLTDAGPFTLASLGLKGQAIFKNFSSFSEAPNDTRHFRNEGRLQVEWARRLASWMDARVVVEARKDDNDYADGVSFQIPETSVHHSVVDLKEAVVRLGGGPAELAVGKQIFAWGTADAFNPTDLVNPRDYLDILDNEKLGVWSVAGRAMLGPASLTTVVVPVFTPSRLPLPDRRWTPPPPSGFVAVVDNRELPERDVDGMQYAARLHGTLAGWDVSVSYYDGFKSTPAFRESSIAVAPGIELPRLTPVFTRIRAPGVDWSTTFAKLEFHGEAVARFATANGRDDRFQGIVGINYTWDALGLPWLDAVTAILEYGRETVLATHDRTILKPGDAGVVGDLIADNAFRDALVGRVELKLTEDTRVKLMEIVDLATTPSHYTQVKLAQRLGDAWSFETGVDVLSGGRRTFWGRWRDNDRVFFWLKYLF